MVDALPNEHRGEFDPWAACLNTDRVYLHGNQPDLARSELSGVLLQGVTHYRASDYSDPPPGVVDDGLQALSEHV